MDTLKKERIALEVIKTVKSKFDDFPEDASNNRNAPFHEAFLNAFKINLERHVNNIPIFVSLASWMHGLNTRLGQSFFEKTAHILCDGEKRKFESLKIDQRQQTAISEIIASLKNSTLHPDLTSENNSIYSNLDSGEISAPNFSADVFFEDEESITLIELKTVKPNSDIFKEQKNKFLYGKAALKIKFRHKKIYFYLGFPFDPLHDEKCGYNKERFFNYSVDFKKYFAEEEILLADELWNFLSQEENTMQEILHIINSIAQPDFIEKFNFINDAKNINVNKEKYKSILSDWFLERELKIVSSYQNLKESAAYNKSLHRVLSQNLFDSANEYKENRISMLNGFNNNNKMKL